MQVQLIKNQSKNTVQQSLCTIVHFDKLKVMNNYNEAEANNRIGYRVKFFRNLRGWTQLELSKKVGISLSYLGNIESAKRPQVSVHIITKIALSLNITPNELIL